MQFPALPWPQPDDERHDDSADIATEAMSGSFLFLRQGRRASRAGVVCSRYGGVARRRSRCERAHNGPRSAHPSLTPGATVRETSLAALAPRAGVTPWGGAPRAEATGPDRSRTDSLGPVCPLAAVLARPWPTSPGPLPRSSGRPCAASLRRIAWVFLWGLACRGGAD